MMKNDQNFDFVENRSNSQNIIWGVSGATLIYFSGHVEVAAHSSHKEVPSVKQIKDYLKGEFDYTVSITFFERSDFVAGVRIRICSISQTRTWSRNSKGSGSRKRRERSAPQKVGEPSGDQMKNRSNERSRSRKSNLKSANCFHKTF